MRGFLWKVWQRHHPGWQLELGAQCRRVQPQQRLAEQRVGQYRLPLTQGIRAWTLATATGGLFLVEKFPGNDPQKHGNTPNREPSQRLRLLRRNTAIPYGD